MGLSTKCCDFYYAGEGVLCDKMLDALYIYDEMVARRIRFDDVLYGTLINGLCKSKKGKTRAVVQLLQKMQEGQLVKPNLVIYNTVVHGLCKDGNINEARVLCSKMIVQGIFPDIFTYSSLIYGLCRAGQRKEVTSLLNGFCLNNKVDEARELFNVMIERGEQHDIINYNILMNGYCLNNKVGEARTLFHMMIERGEQP